MDVPSTIEIEKNAIELVTPVDALDQYAKLAESVGYHSEDIVLYQLRAHIRSAGLSEYSLSDVESYMDEKFGAPFGTSSGSQTYGPIKHTVRHRWGWHPLRASDASIVAGAEIGRIYKWTANGARDTIKFKNEYDQENDLAKYNHDGRSHSECRTVYPRPYNRLIPMPVLQTVAGIVERFPSVNFIVADWADYETTTIVPTSRMQDPFLAVVGPGIPLMIIERWDEPSFR